VEVWYDGDGKMYFRGGWSQFAEDHDLFHDLRLPLRYVEVWCEDLRWYSVPEGVQSWSTLSVDAPFM
jgi:hypothetical protein